MALTFEKPTILVSSKNNRYLVENDPIHAIAANNKKGIERVILDNEISP